MSVPADSEAWRLRSEGQRAGLRRMRLIATAVLVLMLALYVACTVGKAHLPWLAYPAAFAEAATVGACADWFAVTALFRRPFGLPIPHTAILPRNQQRLADSLGAFIASNFLAPAEVAPRLQALDLSGWVVAWLKKPDHVHLVVECCQALLSPALEAAGDTQLRALGGRLIQEGLDSVAAAPMAASVLVSILERGYDRGLYDFGVDQAAAFLRDNRRSIRDKAAEGRSGLGGWIDSKAADAFIIALQESLVEAHAPDHPWRRAFHDLIAGLVDRLADDPETYERCEKVKADVLGAEMVDQYLQWLSGEAETRLRTELEAGDGVVTRGIEHALSAAGLWLEQDERVREMINRWAREMVLATIVPNRAEIGGFVTDVVARWDAATLVERLELNVGKDLQYIRINGAVVGGLVGLVLYIVTHALGR